MEKNFKKVWRGYAPEEVEQHVQLLEQEIQVLRNNETTIAHSIVHAQTTAQNILAEAERKAKEIEENSLQHLEQVQKQIAQTRMKLDAFQAEYNQLIHKYIIAMNKTDFEDLFHSLDEVSSILDGKTKQIEETSKYIERPSSRRDMRNFYDPEDSKIVELPKDTYFAKF